MTTYRYSAFDGQNQINRDGLDEATFLRQWSNLIVCGYRISAWHGDVRLSEDEILSLAAAR